MPIPAGWESAVCGERSPKIAKRASLQILHPACVPANSGTNAKNPLLGLIVLTQGEPRGIRSGRTRWCFFFFPCLSNDQTGAGRSRRSLSWLG
jgi:hypothetical protein